MIDIASLTKNEYLLDLLIKMEDVLDTLDVYVGENWFDGVLISGPGVRRYWLDMTLRYEKMPNPRTALRLLKHGIKVVFEKEEGDDPAWIVTISIPRRLIVDIMANQIAFYDEDIDADDVQAAHDEGIDQESAYVDGERAR